jgi:hypothetical protein
MTRDANERANHLSPGTIEDYFKNGIAAVIPMSTKLGATLEIDPQRDELLLVTPALGADPEVARFERISVERINIIGKQGDWFRLTVDATAMHYEAYVLIEAIVDQLEGGASFRHSVSESLEGFKELLTSRQRMTDEKEAGLIGELLVLAHVVELRGEEFAISSWLGPLAEEHDFGFETFDAEVKTTRSEGRVHVIGSETQLQPVPGRPLYLVSIQITRSGQAEGAFTLPELIGRTRAMLDRTTRTFDSAVSAVGWVNTDADLYRTRFQVRATPRSYLVDGQFPAITGLRLDEIVPQRLLVSSVSYRVDVSHLPFETAPSPLNNFSEVSA